MKTILASHSGFAEGLYGAVRLISGDDGDIEDFGLARWIKDIYKNGFVIGNQVVDDTDFQVNLVGGDFSVLEFAPVVQLISCR